MGNVDGKTIIMQYSLFNSVMVKALFNQLSKRWLNVSLHSIPHPHC